jgi:two-component system OmpR family response regulator
MRVLIIEDDLELAIQLERGLREQGFAVDREATVRDGLKRASSGEYDLLILDRMLPGGDGLKILQQLRDAGIKTPVIFLTARAEIADRIDGLDAGADDYFVNPFSFAELLARIRVTLRRGTEQATCVLQVADLCLDQAARIVLRSGQRIELTAKEFSVLKYLMVNAGHVVSRSMILQHAWDFAFDGMTNVVDIHINRLRNKVDRGFDQPLIHTLRGVGYVLRVDIPFET